MTKKQLLAEIDRLHEVINEKEDRLYSLGVKVEGFEEAKREKIMLREAGEIVKESALKEENRKLWYMLRHLTGDERIPTKVTRYDNGLDKEIIIDPFGAQFIDRSNY